MILTNTSSFLTSSLNKGKLRFVNTIASKKAAKQTMADSYKNWKMICCLLPPVIFLTPTSFALFNEPAMLILIKLTAAINKNKQGNAEKKPGENRITFIYNASFPPTSRLALD